MIVVSDTSPLHYLIIIQAEAILPALYARVIIPLEVLHELEAGKTPEKVRNWLAALPSWLEVHSTSDQSLPRQFHRGEAAAIELAQRLKADLLLIDDQNARASAEAQGFRTTGLLGVLRDAAGQGLVDIESALNRLRQTNFRAHPSLYDQILADVRRNAQEGRK